MRNIPKDKSLYGHGRVRRDSGWGNTGALLPEPKIRLFTCPKCGNPSLTVFRSISRGKLNVHCHTCKLTSSFNISDEGLLNVQKGYDEFIDNYNRESARCCSVCKEKISDGVYNYSVEHFGIPLCMNHQKTFAGKKPA